MEPFKAIILLIFIVAFLLIAFLLYKYFGTDTKNITNNNNVNQENLKKIRFKDTNWDAGKVGILTFTDHGLNVGDVIVIDKDNKVLNPQYDGEHKVVSVVNKNHFTTNIPWGENSDNEGGYIYSYK